VGDVGGVERVAGDFVHFQIDEPGYTAYVDPPLVKAMHDRGEDPNANLLRSILTTLGIIIGVGSVIVMSAIGSGASEQRKSGSSWKRCMLTTAEAWRSSGS